MAEVLHELVRRTPSPLGCDALVMMKAFASGSGVNAPLSPPGILLGSRASRSHYRRASPIHSKRQLDIEAPQQATRLKITNVFEGTLRRGSAADEQPGLEAVGDTALGQIGAAHQ
jgi:hypothetical protein